MLAEALDRQQSSIQVWKSALNRLEYGCLFCSSGRCSDAAWGMLMRLATIAASVLMLCGCATKTLWSEPDRFATQKPVPFSSKEPFTEMLEAIELSEISYGVGITNTWAKREAAAARFSRLGYSVLYYHPQYRVIFRDPNLYLLGRKNSHEITVLFTGTEVADNPLDIVQDLKTSYREDAAGSSFYIPPGHSGFRAGVINIIRRGFFKHATSRTAINERCTDIESGRTSAASTHDVGIADFICRFDILDPKMGNSPIKLRIIGHSLGAGLAQISMGPFSGLGWEKQIGAGTSIDNTWVPQKKQNWPFQVDRAYFFAAPYAIYTRDSETCAPLTNVHDGITTLKQVLPKDRVFTVNREGDMVWTLWNPVKPSMHCVEGEHFGRYFRISHDGEDIDELNLKSMRLDFPHASSSYEEAIRLKLKKQTKPKGN
jgi:hypothetical protein